MVWPFSHFRKPPARLRGTIEAIYGMIVAQAREPLFYRDLAAPDTVNGRFDMLLLHLWLVLRRLSPKDGAVSQGLFDRFCSDMDDNLRELGTSDMKVPKKMREFGDAFYGRTGAYDAALAAGASLWRRRCRRISIMAWTSRTPGVSRFMCEAANAHLGGLDGTTLTSGAWRFPSPEIALQTSLVTT